MRYIDTYEPPAEQGCFLCGAKDGDGHWSGCTFAPEGANADTDPDADSTEGNAAWEHLR